MGLWVKLGLVGVGALVTAVTLSCGSSDDSGPSGTSGSAGVSGSGNGGSGATGGSGGGTGGSTGGTGGGTGGSAGASGTGGSGGVSSNSTEPNLKVAFIGDQGTGTDARDVYQVILDEGADLVLAIGDFDYQDNPGLWETDLNAVLGSSYPLFGVVGNHDTVAWSGYQQKLTDRLAKMPDAKCTGTIGEQHDCTFKGLHIVLSGIGTMGSDSGHETFIENSLAADPDSLWKICAWHQNQRDMQLGDKGDAIGWAAFQSCQKHGAIIAMGHEHTYGRTKTLTDVGNVSAGHGATGAFDVMEVAPGRTFSFYNGLGGSSIRDYVATLHDDDTWWATQYCSNKYVKNGQSQTGSAQYGALFIEFHVDGDPSKARGYFKSIDGDIIDEFTVVRN